MSAIHPNTKHVVIKLGGSVLTDLTAYRKCAAWLARRIERTPHERLVVVVSASLGTTDRLLALARDCCPNPDQGLLDLLWSTGEAQSVALLALCVRRLGADAVGLCVHQCGLEHVELPTPADPVQVNPLPLLYHTARHAVVIVPGFLARTRGDAVVSLGRGGSDLTAVLLAAGLRAARCELIKDVPGYFSADPKRQPDAAPLPHLTFERALSMAAAGCDLVQTRALQAAARTGTPLLVRDLSEHAPCTWVTTRAAHESVPSARVAV